MDWQTMAAAGGVFTAGLGVVTYYLRSEIYKAVTQNNAQLIQQINGTYMRTKEWDHRILRLERWVDDE